MKFFCLKLFIFFLVALTSYHLNGFKLRRNVRLKSLKSTKVTLQNRSRISVNYSGSLTDIYSQPSTTINDIKYNLLNDTYYKVLIPLHNISYNEKILKGEYFVSAYDIKNGSKLRMWADGLYTQCQSKGLLAQTYDDGPSYFTNYLLDILKKRNLKVSFFVLGILLSSPDYQRIVKRIYDEGHILGSHTWSHKNLTLLSNDEIRVEMEKTSQKIYEIIGKRPKYMRPPYGSIDARVHKLLRDMGYKIFMWNLDTDDWKHYALNPNQIFKNVESKLSGRSSEANSWIVLQHDVHMQTINLQEKNLDFAIKRNYKIVRLDECIQDIESPYF